MAHRAFHVTRLLGIEIDTFPQGSFLKPLALSGSLFCVFLSFLVTNLLKFLEWLDELLLILPCMYNRFWKLMNELKVTRCFFSCTRVTAPVLICTVWYIYYCVKYIFYWFSFQDIGLLTHFIFWKYNLNGYAISINSFVGHP